MLTDIQSLQKYLLKNYNPSDFFFVVTFPKDALIIENIFPYNIVCFDDHPIIDQLINQKIKVFSLDREALDNPKRRSTSVLLKHPATKKWINSQSKKPKIIVYKPSPSLEKICANNNWQIIANPSKLNRQFEHKINFSQILTDQKLPQPKYIVASLHNITYEKISSAIGSHFFLQFPRGFAGSSTFEIKNVSDFVQVQSNFLNYPTKFSQAISGPTYSLNACIIDQNTTKNDILVQKPFYQITNIPELNPSPGGTCGNIYSSTKITATQEQKIITDTTVIARLLKSQGYRGIFGLDLVIDLKTKQHYFIECNPRLTASIPMVSKLQNKKNQIPIFALHLLTFLNSKYRLNNNIVTEYNNQPSFGSQIIFRNISHIPQTTPILLKSGIYKLANSKPHFKNNILNLKDSILQNPKLFKFLRPGKDILDIKKENEFLILCEAKNKIISPAIEFLRIQSLL